MREPRTMADANAATPTVDEASNYTALPVSGWLPIVLCPTDGVDRALLLPDGREVFGAYQNRGFGDPTGWHTATPLVFEEPVYEYPPRGGLLPLPHLMTHTPEPERKLVGTGKRITWLQGILPDGVYPTHFRPNDTVYGGPETAAKLALSADGALSRQEPDAGPANVPNTLPSPPEAAQ